MADFDVRQGTNGYEVEFDGSWLPFYETDWAAELSPEPTDWYVDESTGRAIFFVGGSWVDPKSGSTVDAPVSVDQNQDRRPSWWTGEWPPMMTDSFGNRVEDPDVRLAILREDRLRSGVSGPSEVVKGEDIGAPAGTWFERLADGTLQQITVPSEVGQRDTTPSTFTDPVTGERFLVSASGGITRLGGQDDQIAAQLEAQRQLVLAQDQAARAQQERSLDEQIAHELDRGNYQKAVSLRNFKNAPTPLQQLELAMEYADNPEALKVLFDFIQGQGLPIEPQVQEVLKQSEVSRGRTETALKGLYDPAGAMEDIRRAREERLSRGVGTAADVAGDTPPVAAGDPNRLTDPFSLNPALTGPFATSPQQAPTQAQTPLLTSDQASTQAAGDLDQAGQPSGQPFEVSPTSPLRNIPGQGKSAQEALAGAVVPFVVDGSYVPVAQSDVAGFLANAKQKGLNVSVPDQQTKQLFPILGEADAFRFSDDPSASAFRLVQGRDYPTPGREQFPDTGAINIRQPVFEAITSPTTNLYPGTTKLVNPVTGQIQIIATEDAQNFMENIQQGGGDALKDPLAPTPTVLPDRVMALPQSNVDERNAYLNDIYQRQLSDYDAQVARNKKLRQATQGPFVVADVNPDPGQRDTGFIEGFTPQYRPPTRTFEDFQRAASSLSRNGGGTAARSGRRRPFGMPFQVDA